MILDLYEIAFHAVLVFFSLTTTFFILICPQRTVNSYNHDRIQTVTTSEPRRNYFPVPDEDIIEDNYSDEYVPNFDPYAEHESFIGEEQVLNAGYTVKDGNMKPHEYLTSSYERPDKVKVSQIILFLL